MPLRKGYSKESISHNIGAEMNEGKPQKQSIAIALETARRARRRKMAMGGLVADKGINYGKVDDGIESREKDQEDDLMVPLHEDSSGEPHEEGKYEEKDPMEYMAFGGEVEEDEKDSPLPSMNLAFGGEIEADKHEEFIDKVINKRKAKGMSNSHALARALKRRY